MDLVRLAHDWKTVPALRECGDDSVDDLARRLVKIHEYLMSDDSGPLGYLYQQQVRVNRDLKETIACLQKELHLPPQTSAK